MDSAGNSGFDIHNFLKTGSNQSNLASPSPIQYPFHHPVSHPFPPANFAPVSNPSYPNISGSFAFASQTPMYQHPYVHYPQEQAPQPRPYPASPIYGQQGFTSASSSSLAPNSTVPQRSPSPQLRLPSPIPSPPPDGARLMALLNSHSSPVSLELPPPAISASEPFHVSVPPPGFVPAVPTAPPVNLAPCQAPARLLSTKLPRGRHLRGDHIVYDIDLRLPGEAQPQLEVSPITVYSSEPVMVSGHQIAVNRSYICYGLRPGTIRILNINTALRALLRGHSQRVTDMAFFANDVHLLASASSDGRVFVWKIEEGLGEDDKMQITGQIVCAIQIVGDFLSVHPHVCWHSHRQDILYVGVSSYVLKMDVAKIRSAAPGAVFSAEDPVKCNVEHPVAGVSCIGKHDGEVTGLSVCHWSTPLLASASKDGMVKIWGEKKTVPFAMFKPHDGHPVGSVGFLTVPHSPDHTVLLTAGPLNQELKLWVSASSDGWLSPSSSEKWQCIQSFTLRSSVEPRNELAFFNQILVVPCASIILLANAKKNAIYAIHIERNSKPSATRMDYLAEFSVTMPILSFTATSEDVVDGEGTVQIYCVQTQAIQQYALDMSQCLPPPAELVTSENASAVHAFERSAVSAFTPVEPYCGNNLGEMATVSSSAKSPRSTNVAEKVSTCQGPVFVASVDPSNAHDLQAISCVDTTLGLCVPTGVPVDIVPLSSQVPVPLSPRLSRMLSGSNSAWGGVKQGPSAVCSGADHPDKQLIGEHPIESKPDCIIKTLPDTVSLEGITTLSEGDACFRKEDGRDGLGNLSAVMNPSVSIECQVSSSTSYLVTPSQLMSMVVPPVNFTSAKESTICSKNEQMGSNSEKNLELGIKDTGKSNVNVASEFQKDIESGYLPTDKRDRKEKIVSSQASEPRSKTAEQTSSSSMGVVEDAQPTVCSEVLSSRKSEETSSLPMSSVVMEAAQPTADSEVFEDREQSLNAGTEEKPENLKDMPSRVSESASIPATGQSPSGTKRRKNKNKTVSAILQPASTSVSAFTSVGSSDGDPCSTNTPSSENIVASVLAIQEALSQLITMHRELQKQMTVIVAVPVGKEGKRIEATLGQRMEKLLKAQADAMWARMQEENAKRERSDRQLSTLLSNALTKELPTAFERVLKKEIATVGPAVARLVTPSLERAISVVINDAFQKGITDKALPLLEKSVGNKLESVVPWQIQSQFQSSGKQVLQDALRSCFEGSVIPTFDQSCRAMFEQVESAFQKGMAEHTSASQQQFLASHSLLASTLQDTVASASSLVQTLKGELADCQRKLVALTETAGASSARMTAFSTKQSSGGLGGLPEAISLEHLEESLDPTKELSRLVSERKFEEAFNKALQMSDVSIVSWLCSQVDHNSLFSTVPLPLSQGVLLSLVQQLGCDLVKDTARKLPWIREAANVLNPNDPILAQHMRPILEQLYQNLLHVLANASGGDANSIRLVLHVVNSLLTMRMA